MIAARATDALTILIAVGAVLWGGTTHPPATLAFAVAAAALLAVVLWRARHEDRPLRMAPLAWPMAASLVIALLQLIPLPPGARRALSPEAERVTGLLLEGLPHAAWRPLTSDVAATLHAATRAATLIALANALLWMGRRERSLLRWALLSAVGAMLAVTAAGALGVAVPSPLLTETATRALTRFPFVNPNHAASLLALALPVAIAIAVRGKSAVRLGVGTLVLAGNVALWATLSRAGLVLGLLAQAGSLVVSLAPGAGKLRRISLLGAAVIAIGLAVAARPMLSRFGAPRAESRLAVARDALSMLRDHQVIGAGTGAFAWVFTRYSERAARNRFAFVENEYLQVPLDAGWLGALLVMAGLAIGLKQAWRALPGASVGSRAACVGLAALALHNAVDFSWEAGGVSVAACIASALAFPSAGPRLAAWINLSWIAGLVALAALAGLPLGRTADADAEAVRASFEKSNVPASEAQAIATSAMVRHPRDPYAAELVAERLLALGDGAAFAWLDRALLAAPHDLFAHQLLARGLHRAGLPDQAAGELRVALESASDRDLAPLGDEALALFTRDQDGDRLVRALPPVARIQHGALERLSSRGRWVLVARVARAALERDANDVFALRAELDASLKLKDHGALVLRAERLASVDASAAGARLAADALLAAGRPERAEEVLRAAAKPAHGAESLLICERLQQLLLERGDLTGAAAAVDEGLARAVTSAEKAQLHRWRAGIAERGGQTNRAALERAEAERLQRH